MLLGSPWWLRVSLYLNIISQSVDCWVRSRGSQMRNLIKRILKVPSYHAGVASLRGHLIVQLFTVLSGHLLLIFLIKNQCSGARSVILLVKRSLQYEEQPHKI